MKAGHRSNTNPLSFATLAFFVLSLCFTSTAAEFEDSQYSAQLISQESLESKPIDFANYQFAKFTLTPKETNSQETGIWKNYILPPFSHSTRFLKQKITSVSFPFLNKFLKIGNNHDRLNAKSELVVKVQELPKTEVQSTRNNKETKVHTVKKSVVKRRAFALLYLLAGSKGKSD